VDVSELVAREAIRDLVARYNANGDSGRFAHVLALFAADAAMDIDGVVYRGHDEILTIFTGARDQFIGSADRGTGPPAGPMRHSTSTLQIDVTSETTATSRCYYHVTMAHGLDHWGRYLDTYAVVDGEWRFTERREILDGATPGGWAASLPQYHARFTT
jgi:hypothetical protein